MCSILLLLECLGWIRIAVVPGDMIVLPAGMYHRFTLDNNNYIKVTEIKQQPVEVRNAYLPFATQLSAMLCFTIFRLGNAIIQRSAKMGGIKQN